MPLLIQNENMTTADNDMGKLRDFKYSSSLEWLETNGLGGYASSTVSGANSRRYHGLLVASLNPPVKRRVVLSKLEESIIKVGERFDLSANQYPGVLHPQGFQYLVSFERELFPVFIYEAGGIRLRKTIACVHGENTTLILFEVLEAKEKFQLELLPLCSFKDFHSNAHANDSIGKGFVFESGIFQTKNYQDSCELFISVPGSEFQPTQHWYHNFEYPVEEYRGLDFQEDLFNHGKFSIDMGPGSRLGVIISTGNCRGRDAFKLYESELKRRTAVVKKFTNPHLQRLALAADQFIVRRGDELKTIIAGYHWFSDWGRDTMIALPGLCLVTGRFDDARKILKAFADSVSEGMLPNRFPDGGEKPEYNTVDATLWFFNAIYKYYQYTRDQPFIEALLPVLIEILDWHHKGTRYNIHVDDDDLLCAGQDGVQLTWMDAKVGDWVVTPRRGKAVEINALWFNANCIMRDLLHECGDKALAFAYGENATRIQKSFSEVFWHEEGGYLYDYVDGPKKNADIRPNQIYALGLPFSLISSVRAERIFSIVTEKLLTAWGLRSLSADHHEYKRWYGGDPWSRDSSYHQGTVWSHLLGAYIDALINIKGAAGVTEASAILFTFFNHLDEACVGSVSEIFDAELPHHPRGCVAQAWSVAEILRVALEHDLLKVPKRGKETVTLL
jgi:predicted glycogen debranching enzyme